MFPSMAQAPSILKSAISMSASSDIIDSDDSLKEVHAERRTVSSMNIPVAKPEPPLKPRGRGPR